MTGKLPRIALTMGDPAGIGPEICARAATDESLLKIADIFIYGCPDIINKAAAKFAKIIEIVPTGDMKFSDLECGGVHAECGREGRNAVIAAVEDVLDGKMDAIVTAPLCKEAINEAGIRFSGHTEMIAEICGVRDFAMMQSAGKFRVTFVTTHIPLEKVAGTISVERIMTTTKLLNDVIVEEGVARPKIAMSGLNPHAGEGGFMGREEIDVIAPAILELKKQGMDIEGPFPPDTMFIPEIRRRFDGFVTMFHDQGHIPFKMLAFNKGVNSTLGLPIVRTSVDHGTAFGIAWMGKADCGSLYAAIRLAVKRVANRKRCELRAGGK